MFDPKDVVFFENLSDRTDEVAQFHRMISIFCNDIGGWDLGQEVIHLLVVGVRQEHDGLAVPKI